MAAAAAGAEAMAVMVAASAAAVVVIATAAVVMSTAALMLAHAGDPHSGVLGCLPPHHPLCPQDRVPGGFGIHFPSYNLYIFCYP